MVLCDPMIDEDRTMQLFGYWGGDLKPQSHKQVVSICEGCGKYRITERRRTDQLCKTCSVTGDKNPMFGVRLCGEKNHNFKTAFSEEHKRRISENHADVSGENNPFFGKRHTEESKLKRLANMPNQSGKNNPMYGVHLSGELHWNWQGGVTPLMVLIRNSRTYQNWRKAVFERDNYTCQMCDTRGGDLEAHHIHPVRDYKNTLLMYDVFNGITLCVECHKKTRCKENEFIKQFETKLRM